MSYELNADDVRRAEFRSVLRGLDRSEVERFLAEVADRIEELAGENERLSLQIGDTTPRDLESEFEAVGEEVARILQTAREAAEAMRERASLDSARWRSEAMAEADEQRRTATADAEALRRDAWATGTELLKQAVAEATKMREQAERDVLTVMGEAEREAHRLTSGARREAEDVVRAATMDAEKTTSEAAKRRDDIIEAANRAASQAQERTRALEQRRDELLEELENVRSTLTRLEGSLEERREAMDLSAAQDSTSVRVVPSRPPVVEEEGEIRTWQPGETVRVVPPDRGESEPEPAPEPEPEPVPAPEPEPSPEPEPVVEAEPEEVVPEELVAEPTPLPAEEPVVPVAEPAKPGGDDVSALFAALRTGGQPGESEATVTVSSSQPEEDAEQPEPSTVTIGQPAAVDNGRGGTDWIELRDARLLPITNRALRGAKRALAELQNIALDSLRTDDSWRPDPARIAEYVQAEIIGVWAESFAAGHGAAEEMTGAKLKRPPTPSSEAAKDFAKALCDSVSKALDDAGDGQRERQSAASRVYRVWRTDEAERRIRELAIHAFERGVEVSADVGEPVS